jgi:E3 ubiquitin-protein ligase HUWE1
LGQFLTVAETPVVIATLKFLLKPTSRMSTQKALKHNFSYLVDNVEVLASIWTTGTTELDFSKLLQKGSIQEFPATYSYYKPCTTELADDEISVDNPIVDSSKGNAANEVSLDRSRIIIPIEPKGASGRDIVTYMQNLCDSYSIPDKENRALLHQIRFVANISVPSHRIELFNIRLLALSILFNIHSEDLLQKKIFVFEPNLIAKLVELLSLNDTNFKEIQISILHLIESAAQHRGKLTEVLQSLNVSINHGYLLTTVKSVLNSFELQSDANFESSDSGILILNADPLDRLFVEQLFSLLNYLLSTQSGGTMLLSAGVLPLLVSSVSIRNNIFSKDIARCVTIIDNLLYGFPSSLNIFSGINGINALVKRIEDEVDVCVGLSSNFTEDDLAPNKIQDPGTSQNYKGTLHIN